MSAGGRASESTVTFKFRSSLLMKVALTATLSFETAVVEDRGRVLVDFGLAAGVELVS